MNKKPGYVCVGDENLTTHHIPIYLLIIIHRTKKTILNALFIYSFFYLEGNLLINYNLKIVDTFRQNARGSIKCVHHMEKDDIIERRGFLEKKG